jgi:cyclopropane fatty-acyl-phospholipid synthase-like methyltransferase
MTLSPSRSWSRRTFPGRAMVRRTAAEVDECFRTCYGAGRTQAQAHFEGLVFGTDYGGDGWTTVDQADELARRLDLRAGQRLLDIGTGRGWPGLYLALKTGCQAVLTDQPIEGLQHAVTRARRDGIAVRISVLAATVQALPFRAESFDAVVHTDVLCCLRPKLAMLRASRRLLRPGGRTAFFTIHLPPQLSALERRRAIDVGPPAVDSRGRDYLSLLRSAGFVDVEQVDVTAAYRSTHQAWLRHAHAMADELEPAEPPGAFAQRVEEHLATAAAIDDGLLRRSLFAARSRPPADREPRAPSRAGRP